jgi:GNAT superfamily N-acetyltransferase
MAIAIGPVEADELPAVRALVNAHVEAVIPGWGLPDGYLRDHLRRNPEQPIIDPWVRERRTLCALERGQLTAAAHLLRYGDGPEVGADYQNAGDLGWFFFWPGQAEAGEALLRAAHEQMRAWGVARCYAWDAGMPLPLLGGVPDAWPHIGGMFEAAGFRHNPERLEAIYGGWLSAPRDWRASGVPGMLEVPPAPPLPGLSIERTMGRLQTRFAALAGGQAVGHCECAADLTGGGALPALRGWAELGELYVDEDWRNRGVGAWLVRHAAAWLRLGGCDRVAFSVTEKDEAAGAGRFYQRFGWNALARIRMGWHRD